MCVVNVCTVCVGEVQIQLKRLKDVGESCVYMWIKLNYLFFPSAAKGCDI